MQSTYYNEPARDVPVVEHTDVMVAGGGPAGVAAAIAAARTGARVRLLETHGSLGGVWTSSLLCWILDKDNKPGVMQEILAGLDAADARNQSNAYDPEVMKHLLERMCLEAGVDVRLHTRVCAAARDSENRLAVVLTESKSGREAWAAKVFVDATGDGDLAAEAGCGFDLGRDAAGEAQPMSLMCLVAGLRYDELNARRLCRGGNVSKSEAKRALAAEMARHGLSPSYADPTLFPVRDDLFGVMVNHEYGVSALDAQQITEATLRARAELHHIISTLRHTGDIWRDARIIATAEQIGVREARRIHGRYTVSTEDLVQGQRHDDAVCRVTFGIDVHATNPARAGTKAVEHLPFKSQPYDIPYRALLARDVDGLLLAGRCISGDFIAHSSYRVTGNAVAMGEAAGVAAAVSVQQNQLPHQLDWGAQIKCALHRYRLHSSGKSSGHAACGQ
ncbi:FAD-dependent oxidoreductase [Phycisphaerales bacterium AB-hyl4]|uniref:FAD-dependent oxidoreductase n=1 Tax=Natronomicrosphaera hydrolytica TaxID=3242702 RepID=A0ABV4TZI1_9BACT